MCHLHRVQCPQLAEFHLGKLPRYQRVRTVHFRVECVTWKRRISMEIILDKQNFDKNLILVNAYMVTPNGTQIPLEFATTVATL